jgi:hypothetical protein
LSCIESKRANTCKIFLFCSKYETDNPYYSPNHRLHALTGIINTLVKDFSGKLVKISGGHRAPLKNNCEAVVELKLPDAMGVDNIEKLLNNMLLNSLVDYQIMDTGECENADVE